MIEILKYSPEPHLVTSNNFEWVLSAWRISALQDQKLVKLIKSGEPSAVASYLSVDPIQRSTMQHFTLNKISYIYEGFHDRIEWKSAFDSIVLLAGDVNLVLSCENVCVPLRLHGGYGARRAACAKAFPEMLASFIRQCGRPKVGSRYQAIMYALSADPADRSMGAAWFLSHAASWRPLEWWLKRHRPLRRILEGDAIIDRHDSVIGRKVFDPHFELQIRYRRILARRPLPEPKTKGERAIRKLAELRKKRAWDLPYMYGRHAGRAA